MPKVLKHVYFQCFALVIFTNCFSSVLAGLRKEVTSAAQTMNDEVRESILFCWSQRTFF